MLLFCVRVLVNHFLDCLAMKFFGCFAIGISCLLSQATASVFLTQATVFFTHASALVFLTQASAADSWTQFRGSDGSGVASGQSVPHVFGEDLNVTWKTPVPGRAWSSPIVADGLVWLTTAVERMATEEERVQTLQERGVKAEKLDSFSVAKLVTLKLLAIESKSGRIAKSIDLASIENPDSIHLLNSYASPTPVAAHGKLFCHFGSFGTFCVDELTGELVWKRKLPVDHGVGPGSSPVVHGDHLILIQDGEDRQYVTTLDVKTGETIWETDRPPMDTTIGGQKKACSTPVVGTDHLGREAIYLHGRQVDGGL